MTLLRVQNLSVRFLEKTAPPILENLSFEIGLNETLGIFGKSGSGKTTAVRSLLRLLPSALISGSIIYKGQDLLALKEKELQMIRGKEIGFIFQHPASALNPTRTIGSQVMEAFSQTKLSSSSLKIEAKYLLSKVGLPKIDSIFSSYPQALSGGQKQKVLIAMAIASKPKLLIADEPTASLDEEAEEKIIELFQDLREKENISFLIISHHRKLLSSLCSRVLILDEGKSLAEGPSKKILAKYALPKHSIFSKFSAPPSLPPVLEVQNLSTKTPLLQSISLSLYRGETLALMGKNGSGKTSLAKAILQLIPRSCGQILFEGKALSLNPPLEIRRPMQMVFQDAPSSLNPRMTVEKILSEPFQIHRIPVSASRLSRLLDLVSLPSTLLSRYPRELSGGQKQRICIARAVALEPKVLICDEPFSSLDLLAQTQILDLLKTLQKNLGLACLFISHDLSLISQIATQTAVMQEGRLSPLCLNKNLRDCL